MIKRLLLWATALLLTLPSAMGQMNQALPLDTAVRAGVLDNGLHYYIRHNAYPKNQVDFFIAQQVGSVLEEDNQRGLAHFLEHMCFNGTRNFPDNQLVHWLETKGVKFGANLNAYTGTDETVYYIAKVPADNVAVQDSCLLILHDWSNALLLDSTEIDKERGVIHQEWRRSNVGQMRIIEQLLPTIYPGSRYAYRLPIGTMEVVDNFKPQALRDYYHKWYRPDLQGIIVVGDIDVDRIESAIKQIFADIPAPVNPAKRAYFDVPDTEGRIFAIGKDKEQPQAVIEVMIKHDAYPDSLKNTLDYYARSYMIDMANSMLKTRLSDMTSNPATSFSVAGTNYGDFFMSKTKESFDLHAVGKGDSITPAFESIYRELLRAKRGGFTVGEYQRAKAKYLTGMEEAYNNRSTTASTTLAFELVNHFLDNEAVPGIETDYQIAQMLTQAIPLEKINEMLPTLWGLDDNVVIMALLPDNDTYVVPTADDLASIMARVEAEDIAPYVDDTKTEPLIPSLPQPGTIVSTKELPQYEATEWTLSNGARVIAKVTDFKDDDIMMSAVANGGYSTTTATPDNIIFLPYAMWQSGLGNYTGNDMERYLAGKRASVKPRFREVSRTVSGNCSPKDLPTLMEMLYMTFTDYTITPDEFSATQAMVRGLAQNQLTTPDYNFQRGLYNFLYASPYQQALTLETVDNADRQATLDIVHDMLADVDNYTFIFVGKLDLDTLRPLVEQYIATIPARKSTAGINLDMVTSRKGSATEITQFAMETPQTNVYIGVEGDVNTDIKNSLLSSIAGQILTQRLINKIREEMGAVYSISASGFMSRATGKSTIESSFPMKPEMRDTTLAEIHSIINDMADNIKPEELSKIQEYLVKTYTENQRYNSYWLSAISDYSRYGSDLSLGAIDTVNALTTDDVKAFMKNLLDQGNYIVYVQDPAETPTPADTK